MNLGKKIMRAALLKGWKMFSSQLNFLPLLHERGCRDFWVSKLELAKRKASNLSSQPLEFMRLGLIF